VKRVRRVAAFIAYINEPSLTMVDNINSGQVTGSFINFVCAGAADFEITSAGLKFTAEYAKTIKAITTVPEDSIGGYVNALSSLKGKDKALALPQVQKNQFEVCRTEVQKDVPPRGITAVTGRQESPAAAIAAVQSIQALIESLQKLVKTGLSVFWAPSDPLKWKDQISRVANKLVEQGRSVGLLSLGDRPAGSGVVVGRNHVLTNRHVVTALADYDPATKVWTPRSDVRITFDKEYALGSALGCGQANEARSYSINGIFFSPSDGDDLAIVLTSRDDRFPAKVDFKERDRDAYAGNMVVAVMGYPGPPDDMTVAEQLQFFRTPLTVTPQFGYKRVAGGYTGDRPVTDQGFFAHRANTSGGNSGSPVFDLADGTVVGLHVQGRNRFLDQLGYNEALTSEKVSKLLRAAGLSPN
jgi:V8-like Glu-specific endopeptidase